MVPTVALPPITPLTSQVTDVFAVLPSVAVNVCAAPPTWTLSVVGQTATCIVAGASEQAPTAETLAGAVVGAAVGASEAAGVFLTVRVFFTPKSTAAIPHGRGVDRPRRALAAP